MSVNVLIACVMVLCCFVALARAGEFFVAPHGSDANPGTRDKPLASLAGARDAIRALPDKAPGQNITVWFADGTYKLDQTVVFGLQDSAPQGATITYSAIPGQCPVFSAGVKIDGWRKLADYPPDLPAEARGKVFVADLPKGLDRFYTLFDGTTRLPRARCKGFTPPKGPDEKRDPNADPYELAFPEGAIKNWPNLSDVEISVVPWAPWGMCVLPLESVDLDKRIARVGIRASYGLVKPMFGKFPNGSVFVENVFEGLDALGRWVLDSKARKVYLWPTGDVPGTNIIAPRLTEFVRVEGAIDYDGPTDTPVRGLAFRGLTFVHGDRFTWKKDHQGWGLQHDWEMFDAPSAMFRLRGAEDCTVQGCRFTASGATAIRLDLHCQRNRIDSNLIEHIGGAGVLLAGYGPGTKDVNLLNEVTNNHIHHIGETYWACAAIFAWQSGQNRIANNLIHNTPYVGIVVSGRIGYDRTGQGECTRTVRWNEVDAFLGKDAFANGEVSWYKREPLLHGRKNLILQNEIHDVMEVLEDGDGIYISGAGGGNVVRSNYIHHCESVHMAEGIRCDDDQNDTLVEGNVLWRVGGLSTCVAIKGVTHVVNNIMAGPTNVPYCGLLSLEHVPLDGSIIRNNIFYAVHADDRAVRQGKTIYNTEAYLRQTQADANIYFNAADPTWGQRHLDAERPHGIEANSVAADPKFRDPENGDFTLGENSPALKLGFKPIDMKAIGLKGKVGPAALQP